MISKRDNGPEKTTKALLPQPNVSHTNEILPTVLKHYFTDRHKMMANCGSYPELSERDKYWFG